jgi:hypothetical protein
MKLQTLEQFESKDPCECGGNCGCGSKPVNEKFSFSKKEVEAAASLIASAISKTDKVKAEVHDLEYDKGRGAGFEISIDGEKYDGGSYVVKDNGDVVNAAIGNSHPNAVYNTIGNKDIADVFTNMKKYESTVTESKGYKAGDEVELKTGETVKINQVVKGPRAEFNTYRAKVKGKQIDFSLSDINESLNEQSDDALILIQQALKGMKNMKVDIKGDTIIVSNKAKDEFTYSMNDADDVQEFIATIEESVDLAKKKVESLDEGLRNDLKKFIKKNQEELDRLADGEQWEQLYLMLYTEFDVEPESKKAEDVKDAFDLTY